MSKMKIIEGRSNKEPWGQCGTRDEQEVFFLYSPFGNSHLSKRHGKETSSLVALIATKEVVVCGVT